MKSSFGKNIKVSIWGGSHEPAIGVDIEGLPIGTEIDMDELQKFMDRRAPGNSPFATKRKEPDIPVPTAGLEPVEATTAPAAGDATAGGRIMVVTGDRISLEIRNTDTRSGDYKALRTVPRPGHADYTARLRYGDELNMAGGGPFSARMTAPLCIAGGIALQMLRKQGVEIGAHIYSIANVRDEGFDPVNICRAEGCSEAETAGKWAESKDASLLAKLKQMDFPVIDEAAGEAMKERILEARNSLDSVGGIVEACAVGLKGGIGGAMYDGIESVLAPILFGIPAVKGVEFGAGFGATTLRGSENNDPFYIDTEDSPADEKNTLNDCESALCVRTRTNNHGGILGGITSGMPLITRLAFKPTPSISREQDSVDLENMKNAKLVIKGRHDPCVVVRAVPVVEAALALGLLDCIMEVNK